MTLFAQKRFGRRVTMLSARAEQPQKLGVRRCAILCHLFPGVHVSVYELAQLNIGIIKGPMDSPIMADFAAKLERINALAERSPGFVWRLQGAEGDATAI